jgi:hypothetical protein
MRLPRHTFTALALIMPLALVAVLPAAARVTTGSTAWRMVSGPSQTGIELGLARTSNGVLNVVWNHGNPAPTTIYDTRFSPTGAKLGTQTVMKNFGGPGGLALLVMPDGSLRLFAAGSQTTGSNVGGINTFTANARGTGWMLDKANAPWGGPGAEAASTIGAVLTKAGQPLTSWGGYVKTGLDQSYPTTPYMGDMGSSVLVRDGASGAIVLFGEEIATKGKPGTQGGGTYIQKVSPGKGRAVILLSATRDGGVSGVSGRIGASGVYAMYEDNTRVGVSKPTVKLYKYGGGTRTIAAGQFTTARVFAGPAGRLWLVWGDSNDGIFVTRTSRSTSKLEPIQKLTPPSGTSYVYNAQGEGSLGPLDLFVDASVGSGRGFYHTYVLAQAALSDKVATNKKGKKTVTFKLTDAGDPVPSAKIAVSAGGHRTKLKTSSAGTATLVLAGTGSVTATATAPGYAKTALSFSVGS